MSRFSSIAARGAAVVALVGFAGCSKPAPTTAPTPAPSTRPTTQAPTTPTPGAPGAPTIGNPTAGQGGGTPAGANGDPTPRPYANVITPRARTRKGLFSTHVLGSRLYFEIPAKEMGKDMMLVASLKGTPAGIGIRGTLGNNALLRFERKDNRVLVRAVNYRNVSSDTANRINRAMPIIQYYPVIAAFNIEAYGQDSAAVIDVTRMFTGGVQELTAFGQRVAVDPTRSFIERAVAFTNNVEVEASQTFTPAAAPTAAPQGFGGGAPAGATTELYHFSIVKLPDDPMQPRFWDERVIWFRSAAQDFGSSQQRVPDRVFINRWRLVKKDPNAALSEPVKPITYYVDPATPLWLQPWVKKGIEEWQAAFEQAGFKNAIVAKDAPNDPDFSGEDASVSMVRWLPTPVQNAVGPSTVDPRTGEILDADVQMYHNIMSLQRTWYFSQVGHLDPRSQSLQFPDSLMGRLIQFVVAHEVGHTLGFPHNMKASSMYPLDSIRNASFVKRMGHSPSIMDYARFNYVAQPEDNIALADLVPRVGTYDTFAVKWGYTPIPGAKTPEAEKPTLDAWARQQDTIPWFRSADDRGIQGADPGEVNEAVGDADAVRATEYGIRNLKRLAPMVEKIGESISGEDFSDVAEVYNGIVGSVAHGTGSRHAHHRWREPHGQGHQPEGRCLRTSQRRSSARCDEVPAGERLRDADLAARPVGPAQDRSIGQHRSHRQRTGLCPGRAGEQRSHGPHDRTRRTADHRRSLHAADDADGPPSRCLERDLRRQVDRRLPSSPAACLPRSDGGQDQSAGAKSSAGSLRPRRSVGPRPRRFPRPASHRDAGPLARPRLRRVAHLRPHHPRAPRRRARPDQEDARPEVIVRSRSLTRRHRSSEPCRRVFSGLSLFASTLR